MTRRVLTIITVITVFAASLALFGEASADELSDMDVFITAGLLYEEGSYEEAARSYEYLVGLGYEDATLYYNLANSYYRTEDVGRAIVNYLRAKRLAPFDEDIETNLNFVRQQGDGPNSRQATTPVLVQTAGLVPWVSFSQAALVALVSWLVVGLLAVMSLWSERFRRSMGIRRVAAVAIIVILIFGAVAIGKHMDRLHWEQVAVITAESTGVFGGPNTSREARFNLEAGSEIRLVETQGAWLKIGIFDSEVEGWIASSAVERVLEPRG